MNKYNNYKEISLHSVSRKVYERTLIVRMMGVTEGKVGEEQAELKKGKGRVILIFAIRMAGEEYLEK